MPGKKPRTTVAPSASTKARIIEHQMLKIQPQPRPTMVITPPPDLSEIQRQTWQAQFLERFNQAEMHDAVELVRSAEERVSREMSRRQRRRQRKLPQRIHPSLIKAMENEVFGKPIWVVIDEARDRAQREYEAIHGPQFPWDVDNRPMTAEGGSHQCGELHRPEELTHSHFCANCGCWDTAHNGSSASPWCRCPKFDRLWIEAACEHDPAEIRTFDGKLIGTVCRHCGKNDVVRPAPPRYDPGGKQWV